jgi:hypothetical protein
MSVFTTHISPEQGLSRSTDNTHMVLQRGQQGQRAPFAGELAEHVINATSCEQSATASIPAPIALSLASAASTSGNARSEEKLPEKI